MHQRIKTGLKSFSNKDIYASFIGDEFIGFVIKLTKQEQKIIYLQNRKAVNVSPWKTVWGYKSKGIELPLYNIKNDILENIKESD